MHKFKSIRRTLSEYAGPVENLIAEGPSTKYNLEGLAMSGDPMPEMLKNYMDVSAAARTWGPASGHWLALGTELLLAPPLAVLSGNDLGRG